MSKTTQKTGSGAPFTVINKSTISDLHVFLMLSDDFQNVEQKRSMKKQGVPAGIIHFVVRMKGALDTQNTV